MHRDRQYALLAAASLFLVVVPLAVTAAVPRRAAAAGSSFLVNTLSDAGDASPGDGFCETGFDTNGDPDGICPLRAALEEVVALGGGSIGSSVSGTLTPATPYPDITGSGTTIDGSGLTLSGSVAGGDGLTVTEGTVSISDFTINGFVNGLVSTGDGEAAFNFNAIGTDATGATAVPNSGDGILIDGTPDNVMFDNLVSGNGGNGIEVTGSGATGNVIVSNIIGAAGGTASALPNTLDGVLVTGGASANHVGIAMFGPGLAIPNVISGNTGNGVRIAGTGTHGNFVQNDRIGTNGSGFAPVPNTKNGVFVDATAGNVIGGPGTREDDLISGNGGSGILMKGAGATGNKVFGNLIGTDADASGEIGNTDGGVLLMGAPGNTIGGPEGTTGDAECAGDCNVVSGNLGDGVLVKSGSLHTAIRGNFIGLDGDGTGPLANGGHGVSIENVPGTKVGGTAVGTRNLISGNVFDGVHVEGKSAGHTLVRGNAIGTATDGTDGIGNGFDGVGIDGAPDTEVGGTTPGAGNLISDNGSSGVHVSGRGATGTHIQRNDVGTYVGGGGPLLNGLQEVGVIVDGAPGVVIGGADAGLGNVISGNTGDGVRVLDATDARVQGNLIGAYPGQDPSSDYEGNGGDGVFLRKSGRVTVGGVAGTVPETSCSGACNQISGNKHSGVVVFFGREVRVLGNYIGVDGTGLGGLGNRGDGVSLDTGADVTVGGSDEHARNLVSGNGRSGIFAGAEVEHAEIIGNFIGTDRTGAATIPNLGDGVTLNIGTGANQVLVGGTVFTQRDRCAGECNLISGNGGDGVAVRGAYAVILGNFIGTDGEGEPDLGNTGPGVFVKGSHVTVGGGDREGNHIADNAKGVVIDDGHSDLIDRNSIWSNHGPGIDLGDNGVTRNGTDPRGRDGPNRFQNYPGLLSVHTGSHGPVIHGFLESAPNRSYRIQLFGVPTCDGSRHGEGKVFVGSTLVMTDDRGFASFTVRSTQVIPGGWSVTGTAIDGEGNTSEFSRCRDL